MKLSDLDPCLWQPPNQTYDQQPSTSTTTLLNYDYQSGGGGGELSENYTELKPLPSSSVFEYTTNLNQYDVSTTTSNIKTELVEYLLTSDIDDIAALIGSAIAETQQVPGPEPVSSSTSNNVDPWTELDQWIENACQLNSTGVVGGSDNNGETTTTDYISIVNDYNFNNTNSPILQARLQSGSTLSTITTPQQQQQNQNQLPESTSNNTSNYGLLKIEPNYNVLIESNTSPTVSSTSVLINQRFNSNNSNHLNNNKKINNGSFNSNKFSEQKQKKNRNNINKNKSSLSTIELTSDKEKPIHRCSICNRGFLNKSNIKVHLRTHTGEKPFKCEVCGKAFRQKAHLLKHVQIHKRITRD